MEPNEGAPAPAAALAIHTVRVEGFIPGSGQFRVEFHPDSPMIPPPLPDAPMVAGQMAAPPGVQVSGKLGDGKLLDRLLTLAADPRVAALLKLLGVL